VRLMRCFWSRFMRKVAPPICTMTMVRHVVGVELAAVDAPVRRCRAAFSKLYRCGVGSFESVSFFASYDPWVEERASCARRRE